MSNWLRISLIVVAILVGAVNLAIICVGVAMQVWPQEAITGVSVTYTLGSSTSDKDQDTLESEVAQVLEEAYIDATVRATYRGSPDEGWWVEIKLLDIQSEDQADLAEVKLSRTIAASFPESEQAAFTMSFFGEFHLIAIVAALGVGTANLLVAVIAIVLLIKYKPTLSSDCTSTESSLHIGE